MTGNFLFFSTLLIQSWGATVTLFENAHFRGNTFNLTMEYKDRECVNLPFNWVNRVSSAHTGNLCIELHSEPNCNGKKIVLYPSTHHYDLAMWFFDDDVQSVRVCDQVIDDQHLENRFSVLFRIPNSRSRYADPREYHMNVFSCETVPLSIRHNIQSLKTYNTCFHFFSSDHCQGQFLPITPDNEISGTLLQSVVSIGRCGYYDNIADQTTTQIPKRVTTTQRVKTSTSSIKKMASTIAALKTTIKPTKNSEIRPNEKSAAVSKEQESSDHGTSTVTIVVLCTILVIIVVICGAIYKWKQSLNGNYNSMKLTFHKI